MDREEEKYNNSKARYLALLVIQHRHNRNRGVDYNRAVKENSAIKAGIDYWLARYGREAGEIYED